MHQIQPFASQYGYPALRIDLRSLGTLEYVLTAHLPIPPSTHSVSAKTDRFGGLIISVERVDDGSSYGASWGQVPGHLEINSNGERASVEEAQFAMALFENASQIMAEIGSRGLRAAGLTVGSVVEALAESEPRA